MIAAEQNAIRASVRTSGCSAGRQRSKPRSTGESPSTDSAPSLMTCNRIHVKTSASVATRNDS